MTWDGGPCDPSALLSDSHPSPEQATATGAMETSEMAYMATFVSATMQITTSALWLT